MVYSRRLGIGAAASAGAATAPDPALALDKSKLTLDVTAYTRSAKESAMKSAAATMGVQIGIDVAMDVLMVIPIIGWAIDAVLAIIGLYSSWYDKRKIREIQSGLQNSIQATAAAWSAKYAAQVDSIYQAEASAAYGEISTDRANGGDGSGGPTIPIPPAATTGTTVPGLGSFMSNIGQTLAKGFAVVATAPVQYVGTAVLRTAQGAAQITGQKAIANKMGNAANSWTAEAQKGQAALTHDITHGNDLISHFGKAGRIVTGEQQVFDARAQSDSLLNQFTAKITAQYNLQYGQIADPVYRAHLRAVLKGMMIADPALYAAFGQVVANAKTTTLMIAAGGAAVVGWFLFRRH